MSRFSFLKLTYLKWKKNLRSWRISKKDTLFEGIVCKWRPLKIQATENFPWIFFFCGVKYRFGSPPNLCGTSFIVDHLKDFFENLHNSGNCFQEFKYTICFKILEGFKILYQMKNTPRKIYSYSFKTKETLQHVSSKWARKIRITKLKLWKMS